MKITGTKMINKSTVEKKKIFISWSGENSKKIAVELKDTLEKHIFQNSEIECFVSDVDICSGDDWWNKIKKELKKCKLGILCITKENLRAPWIFFEAGAMIARELRLIPLLINCNFKALDNTPLASKHMVDFYSVDKFKKLVRDINEQLNLLAVPNEHLNLIAAEEHQALLHKLAPTLKQLKEMRIFHEKYIYPESITTVRLKTVYISAPMSSISSDEYYRLREFVLNMKSKLLSLGFSEVICPLYDNPDPEHFEGNTKAIIQNFAKLKQVDSMVVIYPNASPSSVLLEIGYGLALCKKTVIFYGESLPYMLTEAKTNISHIDTRKYSSFEQINNIIDANGKQLFKLDEDE